MIFQALRHLSIPLAIAALLGGCAMPGARPAHTSAAAAAGTIADTGDNGRAESIAKQLRGQQIVLLGEVHDNPEGHQLRAQALQRAVQTDWRPAIAMEQFDRENQHLLDKAQASCTDADCVIAMAAPGKTAWQWDFYKPVIALALREHLPLLAANLSRGDASRVIRDGLGSVFYFTEMRDLGLDFGPPPLLLKAQQIEVAEGHCGMLPANLHTGMATAQIARDAMMALVLIGVKDRPVVLLAGNGHVRRDLGVARWLGRRPVLAVGFVEQIPAPGLYDSYAQISAVARPDPCEAFKAKPAPPPPPPPMQAPPSIGKDINRTPFSRLLP